MKKRLSNKVISDLKKQKKKFYQSHSKPKITNFSHETCKLNNFNKNHDNLNLKEKDIFINNFKSSLSNTILYINKNSNINLLSVSNKNCI